MKTGSKLYYHPRRQAEIEESAKIRKDKAYRKQMKALLSPKSQEKKVAGIRRAYFLKVKVLNEKQHKAIALLSDFINCWGPEYICSQVGINLATFYKWRNDPFFLKELDKEITRRRTMFRLEAHRQLFKEIRKAKKGSFKMLLAYLKMTGDFKEQIEVTEKTTDDLDESQLDEEIQRLQDELGISTSEQ